MWWRAPACQARVSTAIMILCGATLAAGCTAQTASGPDDISSGRPVTLAPASEPRSAAAPNVTLGELDEPELRKGLERVRIELGRDESPVRTVGVDLTGDGRPEALALFTGPDWCITTGCSFVVFQATETGYQAVSRTTRVRGPVKVGPGSNAGWRDLVVKTGGGGAPVRFVRLGFTGDGYPKNALLQPGPTEEVLAQSTEVLRDVTFRSEPAQASSAR